MDTIKVKNSGYIRLPHVDDKDGVLVIAEGQKHIPFDIKRVYYIHQLTGNKIRGMHAHKALEQVIFCLNGGYTLLLDDGDCKQELELLSSNIGVILGKKLWHEMKNFTKDCVLLIFASDYYNEADYIRNYEDFKTYLKQHP